MPNRELVRHHNDPPQMFVLDFPLVNQRTATKTVKSLHICTIYSNADGRRSPRKRRRLQNDRPQDSKQIKSEHREKDTRISANC